MLVLYALQSKDALSAGAGEVIEESQSASCSSRVFDMGTKVPRIKHGHSLSKGAKLSFSAVYSLRAFMQAWLLKKYHLRQACPLVFWHQARDAQTQS